MFCPNCGYDQACGCPNCVDKLRTGQKPYIVVGDTDIIQCANCDLKAHIDWWEELGIEVVLLSEGVKSLTELAEKRRL